MSFGAPFEDALLREQDRSRAQRRRRHGDLDAQAATNPKSSALTVFDPATLDLASEDSATYRHPTAITTTRLGVLRATLRVEFTYALTLGTGQGITLTWTLQRITGGRTYEADTFSWRYVANAAGFNFSGTEDRSFVAEDEIPGVGTHLYRVAWEVARTGAGTGTVTPTYQLVQPVEYRQGA